MDPIHCLRCAAAAALLAGACCGSAEEYHFSTNLVLELPDGGGIGTFVQHEVSGISWPIAEVAVTLEIAGTWSGDLFAYLNFGEAHAVLLNRVGRTELNPAGYGDKGFQVTFEDAALNADIHQYRVTYELSPPLSTSGALTGTWAPDGRTTDPAEVVDTDPRTATLSVFDGLDPNGFWTLFLADMEPGAVHQLLGWGLTLRSEPTVRTPQLSVQRVGDGVEVRFSTQADAVYHLEGTTRLPALIWEAMGSVVGTGEEVTLGPFPRIGEAGFFRLRSGPGTGDPPSARLQLHRAEGGLEVRLLTLTGLTYHLEATTELPTSSWQNVDSLPGTGGELVFGPFPLEAPGRLFRIRVE